MSDLNMPGEGDAATDGDMASTEERLADDVGTEPPQESGESTVSAPPPPD